MALKSVPSLLSVQNYLIPKTPVLAKTLMGYGFGANVRGRRRAEKRPRNIESSLTKTSEVLLPKPIQIRKRRERQRLGFILFEIKPEFRSSKV